MTSTSLRRPRGDGSIRRRGKSSWELKFDAGRDPSTGKRITRFVSFKGSERDARRELRRLIGKVETGESVDPSRITVAEYLRQWIGEYEVLRPLTPKTAERYRGLIEGQIIPHLGAHRLQKLDNVHLISWHATLLVSGRRDGGPLHRRTIRHAHRVLFTALKSAALVKLTARNVADGINPPTVDDEEVEILDRDQVTETLTKLRDRAIFPIVVLALASGMRRGELCALRWPNLDLDAAAVHVRESLEQTKAGLRFKEPKTKKGKRDISLPAGAVAVLRAYRKRQLELRVKLGAGKLPDDALVFGKLDGAPRSPNALTKEWSRTVKAEKLPAVGFHALRHTHASQLIAAGMDVVSISRRLGHKDASITLKVYAHLFDKRNKDDEAARIADAMFANAVGTTDGG